MLLQPCGHENTLLSKNTKAAAMVPHTNKTECISIRTTTTSKNICYSNLDVLSCASPYMHNLYEWVLSCSKFLRAVFYLDLSVQVRHCGTKFYSFPPLLAKKKSTKPPTTLSLYIEIGTSSSKVVEKETYSAKLLSHVSSPGRSLFRCWLHHIHLHTQMANTEYQHMRNACGEILWGYLWLVL